MKCSLGISNFLEEISSLSYSIVFLYFFVLITEKGFLISPCYSLELCIQMGISFLFSFPKMSVFTLAISCLTTSNLPWFMDLTFQAPMHYCSLQHQTLHPLPVISTNRCCGFGLASSFFLELFLHSSPIAYWAPTVLGSSSFSVISFCLFILFLGFLSKNTEVVCHSLLQWTTFFQNSLPWPVHLVWPYMAWLIVSLS